MMPPVIEGPSAWAFVWVAHPSGERALRPEVHLFLADRYGRLARHHGRLGHKARASSLDRKAEEHFRLGGGQPPPAVAMAMARPRARAVYAAAHVAPWQPHDEDAS